MNNVITIENTAASISLISPTGKEKIKFQDNGDIFVNGVLVANDIETYELMVEQFKLNTRD